jgi:methylated-DNA-[protein]-cysteine S-methyltransferase
VDTYTYLQSPIGRLRLGASGEGLCAVHMENHAHQPPGPPPGTEVCGSAVPAVLAAAATQLLEYFHDGRTDFDLPLGPVGSPFQHRVWELLRRIPYGTTRSYGELARELGDPKLTRAVGTANGATPSPSSSPVTG